MGSPTKEVDPCPAFREFSDLDRYQVVKVKVLRNCFADNGAAVRHGTVVDAVELEDGMWVLRGSTNVIVTFAESVERVPDGP